MYCDGGSWAGNSTIQIAAPTTTGSTTASTTLYYRGRALLDGLLDKVLSMGLTNAEELLYAGCSAGGLTAYIHTDYVRSRVPRSVKMLGLADAMFSLEHNDFEGNVRFQNVMDFVYNGMVSHNSIDQTCIAHYGLANGSSCLYDALIYIRRNIQNIFFFSFLCVFTCGNGMLQ